MITPNIPTGDGTPLQYFCLENPMDEGAWLAVVHGVTKSQTRLRDFPFTFHFHALEKEMATHSSVLAWRIPGTRESGGLPSLGLHRVGHDWSDLTATATACLCAVLFFQKLCSAPFPPVSHSLPEPRPGPQCCLYSLPGGQSENSWPLGGKYCGIANPFRYSGLHLPCFLQHV